MASIETIEREKLVERSAKNGSLALAQLKKLGARRPGVIETRGRGLLLAAELDTPERASAACRKALASGVITLQAGDDGRVLSISPPLSIEPDLLAMAIEVLMEAVQ